MPSSYFGTGRPAGCTWRPAEGSWTPAASLPAATSKARRHPHGPAEADALATPWYPEESPVPARRAPQAWAGAWTARPARTRTGAWQRLAGLRGGTSLPAGGAGNEPRGCGGRGEGRDEGTSASSPQPHPPGPAPPPMRPWGLGPRVSPGVSTSDLVTGPGPPRGPGRVKGAVRKDGPRAWGAGEQETRAGSGEEDRLGRAEAAEGRPGARGSLPQLPVPASHAAPVGPQGRWGRRRESGRGRGPSFPPARPSPGLQVGEGAPVAS